MTNADQQSNGTDKETAIPRVEERATVHKRTIETGRVRVRTVVDKQEQWVRDAISRDDVEIERVEIGHRIDAVPPVRTEGDTVIVPVVEEVVVVEKHLLLAEEIHIRRIVLVEEIEQPVTLRSMRVIVEREEDTRS